MLLGSDFWTLHSISALVCCLCWHSCFVEERLYSEYLYLSLTMCFNLRQKSNESAYLFLDRSGLSWASRFSPLWAAASSSDSRGDSARPLRLSPGWGETGMWRPRHSAWLGQRWLLFIVIRAFESCDFCRASTAFPMTLLAPPSQPRFPPRSPLSLWTRLLLTHQTFTKQLRGPWKLTFLSTSTWAGQNQEGKCWPSLWWASDPEMVCRLSTVGYTLPMVTSVSADSQQSTKYV